MTIDDIRRGAKPFPVHALSGSSALCLFCAGFLGANAEIHVLDAGMTALCVDSDVVKLAEMRDLYPPTWTFVDADAYRLLADLEGRHFDVIVADPQLDQMARCFDLLPTFRAMGKRVVLGIAPDYRWNAYDAGATDIIKRTEGAYWAVF